MILTVIRGGNPTGAAGWKPNLSQKCTQERISKGLVWLRCTHIRSETINRSVAVLFDLRLACEKSSAQARCTRHAYKTVHKTNCDKLEHNDTPALCVSLEVQSKKEMLARLGKNEWYILQLVQKKFGLLVLAASITNTVTLLLCRFTFVVYTIIIYLLRVRVPYASIYKQFMFVQKDPISS